VTNYDKVIPPGSEGKVTASIKLSHLKGQVEKGVDIETNDPAQQHARLVIRATVKSYVDVLPAEQLNFMVNKGESQTQELTIVPTYEKPITVTGASSNNEMFEVEVQPGTASPDEKAISPGPKGPQYKLKVRIKEDAKIGKTRAALLVNLSGGPQSTLEIPILVTVRGPISVDPPLISFQIRSYPQEVVPLKTVNVRQSPDVSAAVTSKASLPATLRVIAAKDEWYQVITNENKVGWVNRKGVKVSRKGEDVFSQKVSIIKTTQGNFKVLKYSSTIPQVKVEMVPQPNAAKKYDLKVSLLNRDQIKSRIPPGQIIIETDDSEQPELTIPVYISVS
jgi:Bacterial SH3 domain